MQATYTPWLIYLSIAVAVVVSYTALSLASRVTTARSGSARAWLTGGAIVMGIGIWSMHFIGMLALSLPINLAYDIPTTLLSLGIAIGTSAFALLIISRTTIGIARLAASAVIMGAGISSMHYTGMASVSIVPGITYEPLLLAASIVVAITASFAALWLAFRLKRGRSWQMTLARIAAAIVMGLAISGMHYTGMAASKFAVGSYCLSGAKLDNHWFALVLGVFAFGVMAITLLTVIYDVYLQQNRLDRDDAIDAHVRNSNRSDSLTGLPNRVALSEVAELAIEAASRNDRQLALLVLDVDRLKSINDSLGHHVGDELLRELSLRLNKVLRHNDTLARLAGDEFTILATELRSARDAEAIAEKVIEALQQKFTAGSVEIHPSVSIGISTYPLDGETFEVLLRRASAAMRYTKDSEIGRAHV